MGLYKGLPLVDAPVGKDLEIEVTRHDVNGSRQNDPAQCAAAKATSRLLKTEVEVHLTRTYVKDHKRWVRYITPAAIAREIVSFDRSSVFEPGSYTLKSPHKSMRLGFHAGGHVGNSSKHRRTARHVTVNVRESAKK